MNPSDDEAAGEAAHWAAIQKVLARFGKAGWLDTATISEDLARLEFTDEGIKVLNTLRAIDTHLGGLSVPEMSAIFTVALLAEPPDSGPSDEAG